MVEVFSEIHNTEVPSGCRSDVWVWASNNDGILSFRGASGKSSIANSLESRGPKSFGSLGMFRS